MTTALAVVAAVLVGATVAAASIPGPDGTVHGCYRSSDPGSGALYVIDSEESCPTGFTGLDWDQTAPAGLQGYEVVSETLRIFGPKSAGTTDVSLECPAGKVALGGSTTNNLVWSRPLADGTGWEFSIEHPPIVAGSNYATPQRVTCALEASP